MAAVIDGKEGALGRLAALGRCVDSSTIYIVLALDSTIHALEEVDQIARALTLSCDTTSREITMNPVLAGCLLDPTGEVVGGLWAGQQRIDQLLPGLVAQSSSLAQMDASDQGQRDLLIFAFERCIESFGWVVDAAKKLRQSILAHDMVGEPESNQGADAALPDPIESNAA